MMTPTGLLQHLDPTSKDRLFTTHFDEPSAFEVGSVTVERGSKPYCIQLRAHGGIVTGPACNPHIPCKGIFSNAPWGIEVFRLSEPDTFYAQTDSFTPCEVCCERTGMSFTGDGRRLDDGVLQRISRRLDTEGTIAAVIGLLGLIWALRAGRRAWPRSLILAGFGVATAMLWWNH
jgi:hypothetical protein